MTQKGSSHKDKRQVDTPHDHNSECLDCESRSQRAIELSSPYSNWAAPNRLNSIDEAHIQGSRGGGLFAEGKLSIILFMRLWCNIFVNMKKITQEAIMFFVHILPHSQLPTYYIGVWFGEGISRHGRSGISPVQVEVKRQQVSVGGQKDRNSWLYIVY